MFMSNKALHHLFTDINEELVEANLALGFEENSGVVPLTDVNFYEEQLTFLYQDEPWVKFEEETFRDVAIKIKEIELQKRSSQ